MFRHPIDRLSKAEPSSDFKEDVLVILHITIAFIFIVVGLEILLPWTLWPLAVGIYLALWVGVDLYKQLWGKGLYILNDEDPASVDEE